VSLPVPADDDGAAATSMLVLLLPPPSERTEDGVSGASAPLRLILSLLNLSLLTVLLLPGVVGEAGAAPTQTPSSLLDWYVCADGAWLWVPVAGEGDEAAAAADDDNDDGGDGGAGSGGPAAALLGAALRFMPAPIAATAARTAVDTARGFLPLLVGMVLLGWRIESLVLLPLATRGVFIGGGGALDSVLSRWGEEGANLMMMRVVG